MGGKQQEVENDLSLNHTNAHHEKSPQSESSNPQIRLYLFVFQSMYLPILPFLLIYGRIDDQLLLN